MITTGASDNDASSQLKTALVEIESARRADTTQCCLGVSHTVVAAAAV